MMSCWFLPRSDVNRPEVHIRAPLLNLPPTPPHPIPLRVTERQDELPGSDTASHSCARGDVYVPMLFVCPTLSSPAVSSSVCCVCSPRLPLQIGSSVPFF